MCEYKDEYGRASILETLHALCPYVTSAFIHVCKLSSKPVPVYTGSAHGMNSVLCANCSEQSPALKHKRRVGVADPAIHLSPPRRWVAVCSGNTDEMTIKSLQSSGAGRS